MGRNNHVEYQAGGRRDRSFNDVHYRKFFWTDGDHFLTEMQVHILRTVIARERNAVRRIFGESDPTIEALVAILEEDGIATPVPGFIRQIPETESSATTVPADRRNTNSTPEDTRHLGRNLVVFGTVLVLLFAVAFALKSTASAP